MRLLLILAIAVSAGCASSARIVDKKFAGGQPSGGIVTYAKEREAKSAAILAHKYCNGKAIIKAESLLPTGNVSTSAVADLGVAFANTVREVRWHMFFDCGEVARVEVKP